MTAAAMIFFIFTYFLSSRVLDSSEFVSTNVHRVCNVIGKSVNVSLVELRHVNATLAAESLESISDVQVLCNKLNFNYIKSLGIC